MIKMWTLSIYVLVCPSTNRFTRDKYSYDPKSDHFKMGVVKMSQNLVLRPYHVPRSICQGLLAPARLGLSSIAPFVKAS